MKIEISEQLKQTKREYPYIGVIKNYDCSSRVYVLFISPQRGVCLDRGSSVNMVGALCDTWAEPEFEVFQGTITITQ